MFIASHPKKETDLPRVDSGRRTRRRVSLRRDQSTDKDGSRNGRLACIPEIEIRTRRSNEADESIESKVQERQIRNRVKGRARANIESG